MASILPDYNAVIFDEAHEIEDIAGQYFGFAVQQLPGAGSAARYRGHVAGAEVRVGRTGPDSDPAGRNRAAISSARCRAATGRTSFTDAASFSENNGEVYRDLLAAFDLLASHLKLIDDAPPGMIPLFRRAHGTARGAAVSDRRARTRASCYWIERRGRGTSSCRPRRSMWPICCASISGTKWTRRC